MATSSIPKTKTFIYHSYKNGAFQGTLTNVISDFEYQQEINSAGSAITIILGVPADSYGEGKLIDFNNDIQIYEADDANPNGTLIFRGFIVNYKPVFTETNQEQVILTVMGYGATLNDYVLESTYSTDVNQVSTNASAGYIAGPNSKTGGTLSVVQSITIGAGITKLSSIQLKLAAAAVDSVGSTVLVQIFSSRTDAESGGLTSLIGSASQSVTSTSAAVYTFTFGTSLTITPGATYWIRVSGGTNNVGGAATISISFDTSTPLVGQTFEQIQYDGISSYFVIALTGSLYIVTYQTAGNTLFSYNSQDPSAILKSVMDNFAAQGGKITYTAASIDLTATTVTYQFNANTIYDAINKVLSLAPVGWYWYIDQANNIIHFHKVSSTAQHKLTIGKNIKNLAVEKRAQDLVNVVYFVGGPTAGVNLYNKYILQTSIDLYGRHALVYSDNNVTLAATAQIISNNILSTRGQVELRIDIDILDDGGDSTSALGFDIESIVLGESVSFRSFGPGSGGTLWDVAKWDLAKWDFDITDLSSVIVQVTKIDYQPDVLHLSMSTVPPDITKRVQDIYRNLTQANTLNNPAAPS